MWLAEAATRAAELQGAAATLEAELLELEAGGGRPTASDQDDQGEGSRGAVPKAAGAPPPAAGLRKGSPTVHADADAMAVAAGFACFREMAASLEAADSAGSAAGGGLLAIELAPPPVKPLSEGEKAAKRTRADADKPDGQ